MQNKQMEAAVAITRVDSAKPFVVCSLRGTLPHTRNLRPLERDGLIRTRPGADRRVREVSLTRAGHAVMLKAYPLWQRVQAKVARKLGPKRMKHLIGELTATVDALRD